MTTNYANDFSARRVSILNITIESMLAAIKSGNADEAANLAAFAAHIVLTGTIFGVKL